MRKVVLFVIGLFLIVIVACEQNHKKTDRKLMNTEKKIVVYQVFTRLFGNTNTNNKPWGTIEENGVGKFEDFSLRRWKKLRI